ncbi:hypothetical protein ULO1_11530 [Carboxydocella sp. ULO1]|nr:hypothetical protein ULO1_11530 [Carboxydocella sp. ULO1]
MGQLQLAVFMAWLKRLLKNKQPREYQGSRGLFYDLHTLLFTQHQAPVDAFPAGEGVVINNLFGH